MNIFMMILVAVFMVGFYMISSPSQRVPEQETEYAINKSDMRAVAECASAQHNAQIRGTTFQDVCIEQNYVRSQFICLGSSMRVTSCEILRNKRPEYSYIVTATGILPDGSYNDMLSILEEYFPDAGAFGVFMDGKIMTGGTVGARIVPDAIIDEMELENGQLVYLTQYEIPTEDTVFSVPVDTDIVCPVGTVKTYKFGRWQCVGYNTKIDCGGDTIWDSELMTCVADESKKPLCAEQQTAVLVDSVWECVNPFPEKVCPSGWIARLNYTTLEWECVADPSQTPDVKKCDTVSHGVIFGPVGTTPRVPSTSCTDCEVMITNPDTCVSTCVPDPSKVNNPACFPGDADECTGPHKGIYFGFPNRAYATSIDEIRGYTIPLDAQHSQNRMFNCLDCGNAEIDSGRSVPPYISVCKSSAQ